MAGKRMGRRRRGKALEGKGVKEDEDEHEDEEGETGEEEDADGDEEDEEEDEEEEGDDELGDGEAGEDEDEGEGDEDVEGDEVDEEGDSEEDEADDEDEAGGEEEDEDGDEDEEDEEAEGEEEDEAEEEEDEDDEEEDEVEEDEDEAEEEEEEEEESDQEEGRSKTRKKKKKGGRRGPQGRSAAGAGARKSVVGRKERENDKAKASSKGAAHVKTKHRSADRAPHGEEGGLGGTKPKGAPKTSGPAEEYKSLRGRLLHNKQDQKAQDALVALQERLGEGEDDQALAKSIGATLAYVAGLEAASQGDFAVAAEKLEAAANDGERAGTAAAEAHLHLAQDRFRAVLAEGRRCDRRAKRGTEAAPAEARQMALDTCREAASRARSVAGAARERLAEEKPMGRKGVPELERERQRLGQVEEAVTALLRKLDEAPTEEEEPSGQIFVCRAEGALPGTEEEDLSSSDDSGVESDTEAAEEENKTKTKALVMEIFHSLDSNKDGHISQDELRVVLLKIGFDEETIKELFAAADVDEDGRIDYNEFCDWVFGGSSPDLSPFAGLEQQMTEGGTAETSVAVGLAALKPVLLRDRRLCQPEGQTVAVPEAAAAESGAVEEQASAKPHVDSEGEAPGPQGEEGPNAAQGEEAEEEGKQPGICFSQTQALLGMAVDSLVPSDKAKHPLRAEAGSALMESSVGSPEDASDQELVNFLFFDSMPKTHVSIDSIQAVARPELLKRFLAKVAEDQSCVEATFHGTKEERVAGILEGGLSTRCCSVGLYGSGAYVGTHAGLAHKYTLPNGKGRRYMFVVLVDVGPDVVEGNHATSRKQGKTSVDRLANPTQYCLFHQDRLFVSHLITYHVRKQKDERGHFTRELSKAVVRAGERARARGSL